MKRRHWSAEETEILVREYADTPTAALAARFARPLQQVYAKATSLGLRKSEAYLASPHACRLRRGDHVGAPTRFKPGHVPANKGLRRPGWYAGRMLETQFKKGTLNGRAARLYVPIGTERLSKEGYLQRKFTNELRGAQRWKHVHVILWEERYGPVPKGYAVKFIDGDRRHVAIDNLCLVSRRDLAAMNRIWTLYPRELALAIQLQGQLKRKINRRARDERHHRSA